ncbi:MAG TPA: hypothetical protein DIT04_05675 [Dysgonomonas sp.]|nr:hypothetical protein [Dysgonomonas sp.]
MKRVIVIILTSLIAINGYSQTYLGFKGAFSISSLTTGDAGSRPGFNVGAVLFTPVSESWYFNPNILFSLNGAKSAENYDPDFSSHFYSIETPILLSYRIGDEQVSFGFDMGVFARYGLFGGYWTDTAEGRIKPDIFDSHKRFDVGPQLGMSVIVNKIYMGCGVQYGLIKPWENRRGKYLNYNLSFGYLFEL